jgi:hypothetical protein
MRSTLLQKDRLTTRLHAWHLPPARPRPGRAPGEQPQTATPPPAAARGCVPVRPPRQRGSCTSDASAASYKDAASRRMPAGRPILRVHRTPERRVRQASAGARRRISMRRRRGRARGAVADGHAAPWRTSTRRRADTCGRGDVARTSRAGAPSKRGRPAPRRTSTRRRGGRRRAGRSTVESTTSVGAFSEASKASAAVCRQAPLRHPPKKG